MKKVSFDVYQFNELNEKAKRKAIDYYRENYACQDDWYTPVIKEIQKVGELLGFSFNKRHDGTAEIHFEGFNTPGDGACFSASWESKGVKADEVAAMEWDDMTDTRELDRITGEFDRLAKLHPGFHFWVKQVGSYYNKFHTDYDYPDEYEWIPSVFKTPKEMYDHCVKLMQNTKDFMDWIYGMIESEYEYLMSDDVMVSLIEANEYWYLETGENKFNVWKIT